MDRRIDRKKGRYIDRYDRFYVYLHTHVYMVCMYTISRAASAAAASSVAGITGGIVAVADAAGAGSWDAEAEEAFCL